MAITAADVAKLRDMTGVGMMSCKKALEATGGDLDKACEYLREQGMSVAAKKASRIAAEGAVVAAVSADKHSGVLVEVNCESDFVAHSDVFVALCKTIADVANSTGITDVDNLKAHKTADGTIEELINTATAKTGEKISLRRVGLQQDKNAVEETYIHMGGKMGTLVEFVCEGSIEGKVDEIVTVAHDVAMHVAAFQPAYIRKTDVPAEVVEHERSIIHQQLLNDEKAKNKPEQVLAKIADNKLGKFYEENCLLYQAFFKDPSVTIEQYIAACAVKIELTRFTKFVMGEGIEKRTDNLAEEVAKMSSGK